MLGGWSGWLLSPCAPSEIEGSTGALWLDGLIGFASYILENTGKFLFRDLAALTNNSYCNYQYGALKNRFPVMMTPIGWREFPTIFWSECCQKVGKCTGEWSTMALKTHGGGSPEVQNRGHQWPVLMDLGLQKYN